MSGSMNKRLSAGTTSALGAVADRLGTNFALVAPHAQDVVLCLFDEAGHETARHRMAGCENGVWHGYLAGAGPGTIYGYRVHGEHAPERGHRFNPAKLLLDPYAREILGVYRGQDEFGGDSPDDTGPIALKARVVDDDNGERQHHPPRTPLANTVLYEAHVKGMTRLHPAVPEALRGTYAGFAHPAVLDHLCKLGVTAVNLLPVHARADEARLQKMGLSNYWGYNSIGFFAAEPRYWSGRTGSSPASEFRGMVAALHARGIEVILDVVYNHTAETDELGPTLSLRGIDNALYYRLDPDNPARYENWTGCGNMLDLSRPRVLQLVMDSLRYWVQQMHVDGFRFDLATVLARDAHGFQPHSAFLAAVAQDPVLSRVKLIAEPWDIGPGGYQLGRFPPGWMEWNDRYRDDMRRFWVRGEGRPGDYARRFAASSDLFRHEHRSPLSSVNYITSHDGFTLHDLVSHDYKHNQANGEGNRDGHGHNLSWNCGVEGVSTDPEVMRLRGDLKRALLATLLFSQGTPMLLAGDEIGHSQRGNNNAYCQDNDTTWLDWQHADTGLLDYVARLIRLRAALPALRHDAWHEEDSGRAVDIAWLSTEGEPLQPAQWERETAMAIRLDEQHGRSCLLLVNRASAGRRFLLPDGEWQWQLSSADAGEPQVRLLAGEASVPARAVVLAVSMSNSSMSNSGILMSSGTMPDIM
ncbi:glycogen debranching protein GlgX [Lacisediminimonas profundi]|uniref:glycogen debranching protein GlgX n=1 Tax=Lacisediminimonas profundi TaxID=2603856 RepID=UPI001F4F1C1C|nr:glycogen debranching protein GlgX [Lacisediminimonas profundi]